METEGSDIQTSVDFHVFLAERVGQEILANVLRGLTARTILIASLYRSTQDAWERSMRSSRSPARLRLVIMQAPPG